MMVTFPAFPFANYIGKTASSLGLRRPLFVGMLYKVDANSWRTVGWVNYKPGTCGPVVTGLRASRAPSSGRRRR